MLGGQMTATGMRVGPAEALTVPGISACTQVISDDMAKTPLRLYRRVKGGGRVRAEDHQVYRLLKDHPAPWLTSYAWRRALFQSMALTGNSYARPRRDAFGVVDRVTNLKTRQITHRWADDGEPFFDLQLAGGGRLSGLGYQDIVHHHYRGSTEYGENGGIYGCSPLATHKETIGLAIATEAFAAKFFKNGARPSAVIETDKTFTNDEVANRMRRQVENILGGVDNAGKVAILELGLKLKQWSVNNNDAQLVELRKQQAADIATMWRVPPHKIGILDKATFSNIEHQSMEYVTDTLMPLAAMSEQQLEIALLSESEQEEYFIEYDLDGLLRGDLASRYRAYAIGRQWGWLSADDILAKENQNALPDGKGQIYLTPINMAPAGEDPSKEDPAADDGPDRSRNRPAPDQLPA
jgi:HK97 family phage portal protein